MKAERADGPPPPCPRCGKEWPRGSHSDGGETREEWGVRTQHTIRCAARCSQWPDCRHDWTAWEKRVAPSEVGA